MPELADIFLRHGPEYLARYRDRMPPSHRRAMQDIVGCRTEAQGGHVTECSHCGHQHYAYHSCRGRSCPKCHGSATLRWIEQREEELLPVPYFHLVFTLPKELHAIVRSHQKVLYAALMKAAASSLATLARDPRYLGARPGLLCVLHTWTRAMIYHPHVHCLVPAGGVDDHTGRWRPARNSYLVPVRALSTIFRAQFMALVRNHLPRISFPESVWNQNWVVFSKPAFQGSRKVVCYLGRYVHRIAITNNRILSLDDHAVSFRYKDSRDNTHKTMRLDAPEFIRRFLQHVLPKGFHKVRYYGFLAPGARSILQSIKQTLSQAKQTDDPESSPAQEQPLPAPARTDACPQCTLGHMVIVAWLPRTSRAPP
jgi:hypothetical protein